MKISIFVVTCDCKNDEHMNSSDSREHVIVKIKTIVQVQNETHQVAHIYLNKERKYTGHRLYDPVKKDKKDKKDRKDTSANQADGAN